jgi:hypothetical protein
MSWALVASEDTVGSRGMYSQLPPEGYPDSIYLVNASDDTVRIDSVCLVLRGNRQCSEIAFAKHPGGDHFQLQAMNAQVGDTVLATDFPPLSQFLAVPPRDSVVLAQFMQGSCLFCTAPVATFDCEDEVLMYASDGTLTTFVVVGPYATGGALRRASVSEPGHSSAGRGSVLNLKGQRVMPNGPVRLAPAVLP